MASNSRFFEGITQTPADTSAGPCDMPILYRDASVLGLFWRVDPARAASLVDAPSFEPFVVFGKAVVLLVLFEYRETTVGPYGEIGLAILTRRKDTRPSVLKYAFDMKGATDTGLYVVNLPVTTEPARAAGAELWGFPKYVTGITTDFRGDGATITLEGELELTFGRGRGPRLAMLPFCTFTEHQGRVLRTVVDTGGKAKWGGAGSARLKILGDGPTADTARALGLDQAAPSFAFRNDGLLAILPFGHDVGAAEGSVQQAPAAERVA